MQFGHEKLHVYQRAVEYARCSHDLAKRLNGPDRNARDHLLRASQSIALNIAEGNGKGTEEDRRRFFEIARGSALECAAIQDILMTCGVTTAEETRKAKDLLFRIVSMLTKIGKRESRAHESTADYGHCGSGFGNDGGDRKNDYDYDNDNDHGYDRDYDSSADSPMAS